MGLSITVQATLSEDKQSFLIKDTTGTYDPVSNPGGWGSPNYATTDVARVNLEYNKMGDGSTTQVALSSALVTSFLAGNQITVPINLFGLTSLSEGEHNLTLIPAFLYVQGTTTQTLVNTTVDSKEITLYTTSPNADLRLALTPRAAIALSDEAASLSVVSMTPTPTSTLAYVLKAASVTATGVLLYVVVPVTMTFLVSDEIGQCILDTIGSIAAIPDPQDPEVDRAVYMLLMNTALELQVFCGNYAAAEDIKVVLGNMCGKNCRK